MATMASGPRATTVAERVDRRVDGGQLAEQVARASEAEEQLDGPSRVSMLILAPPR